MSFLTNVKEYDIKANIKHFVTIILNALLPLLNPKISKETDTLECYPKEIVCCVS